MNRIKFSHYYDKFFNFINDGSEVMLIQVLKIKYIDLSHEFRAYDTSILKGGFYELPKTDLLILFFRHELGIFTTIRRSTPDKERYYQSKVGQQFKVVIDEEEKEGLKKAIEYLRKLSEKNHQETFKLLKEKLRGR